MDIYVGNISYDTTEASLSKAFEPHGTVVTARIVTDKLSGRSRGFGFVKMADAQEAAQAIEAINGSELDGMVLTVNEARPREERPARDFHREGRGGFDRGRGGPQRSGGFGNNRGHGHNRNGGGGSFGHRSRGGFGS
ncbi:MAG: RNA-binding protein [Puniceicoccales bacterium]|jgi:RNA recognition motif-containing protein|nr:RNA-binding protein [Puniceicoccales bacterium]